MDSDVHEQFQVAMSNVQKYKYITRANTNGHRYGAWAKIDTLIMGGGPRHHIYYGVSFDDGETDLWPIYDPWDAYRFK